MNDQDPMAGMEKQEAKYNNLKFGKVGDWFRGTLVENSRTIVNQLSPKKELQTIFEFMATGGSFHNIVKKQIDANPTIIAKGDFWSYITSNGIILSQLKKAKLGQIIGLRFTESKPSKIAGQDASKIISVYIGGMDPEYQGQTSQDK